MELTKKTFEDMLTAAMAERKKALEIAERQMGVIAMCEYVLKNATFNEPKPDESK